MNNISLFITLGVGVASSFALFLLFYLGLRWNNKLAALVTILLVQAVYIPLALLHWVGIDVFAIHFAFFVMTGYGLGIITSHKVNKRRLDAHMGHVDTEVAPARWFHWAPATIAGFFLILAVVDATIITLASKGASSEFMARFLPEPRGGGKVVSAFPGTVSHDFHQKYDQFNHYMTQLEAQRERGWKVVNGWQQEPQVGKPSLFSIGVTDKSGQPVTGAVVEVIFLRPADKRMDKQVMLTEGASGTYGLNVQLDAPGSWDVVLLIRRGEELHEMKGKTSVAAAG